MTDDPEAVAANEATYQSWLAALQNPNLPSPVLPLEQHVAFSDRHGRETRAQIRNGGPLPKPLAFCADRGSLNWPANAANLGLTRRQVAQLTMRQAVRHRAWVTRRLPTPRPAVVRARRSPRHMGHSHARVTSGQSPGESDSPDPPARRAA